VDTHRGERCNALFGQKILFRGRACLSLLSPRIICSLHNPELGTQALARGSRVSTLSSRAVQKVVFFLFFTLQFDRTRMTGCGELKSFLRKGCPPALRRKVSSYFRERARKMASTLGGSQKNGSSTMKFRPFVAERLARPSSGRHARPASPGSHEAASEAGKLGTPSLGMSRGSQSPYH